MTRMIRPRRLFVTVALALAGAAAATPASAQITAERAFRPGTWMFTAGGGGAAFTDFQRVQASPMTPVDGLGDFERRVSARTSGTVGGSVAYWFTSHFGIRAGTAWTPTGFSVTHDEAARRVLEDGGTARAYRDLSESLSDVVVLFRPAVAFGRVAPYGIVGGGYVAWSTRGEDEMPPEARERFGDGSWSGPAIVFGAGAMIPLQRRDLLLSFELTNHLTRPPLDGAGGGEQFELNEIPLVIRGDRDSGARDVGATSNLRLVVGLTLPVH